LSKVRKYTAARRALLRSLVMIFGNRALLQTGYPGQIARWLGCPPSVVRPHPYTLYELNPAWRSDDGGSMHNSLGFRGPEISTLKPEGRLRIVCMGESSTYCTGLDDVSTYPYRLGEHLKRLKPGVDLEVINAGVAGYTSIENILRLLFNIVPLSPDLIVYYYTHNDVHPRWYEGLSRDYREYSCSWFEPPSGGLSGWQKKRHKLATAYVGNIVRRRDKRLRSARHIAGNRPDAFRANLSALALLAKAAGASVVFVNPNYRPPDSGDPAADAVWEHRRVVEDIGERVGASIIDLNGRLDYSAVGNRSLNDNYRDAVHFTGKGADAAARIIAEQIVARDLLRSGADKPLLY
jgi:lysophospholipase L1-like esterase